MKKIIKHFKNSYINRKLQYSVKFLSYLGRGRIVLKSYIRRDRTAFMRFLGQDGTLFLGNSTGKEQFKTFKQTADSSVPAESPHKNYSVPAEIPHKNCFVPAKLPYKNCSLLAEIPHNYFPRLSL